MKPDIEELRKKYIENPPPEGMNSLVVFVVIRFISHAGK